MLFQTRHFCPDPDCGNLVDFTVSQVGEIVKREPEPSDPTKFRPAPRPGPPLPAGSLETIEACGLSRCPHCGEPLLIIFRTTQLLLRQAIQYQNVQPPQPQHRLVTGDSVVVVRTYPESRQPIAHPTWPEEIRRPFVDLQMMLSEHRHPSFIIAGCRSILGVATKNLGGKSNSLFERIDELAKLNIVTGALKDWAHKLRLEGNDAVHELKGTEQEATQLVEFIKLFLHVAYELPDAISTKAPPGTVPSAAPTPSTTTSTSP
jgi:hypothetical protein